MIARSVFFISDRTGITAQSLGHSLLTQFPEIEFERTLLPFVDTVQKAEQALQAVRTVWQQEEQAPLVFCTFVHAEVRAVFAQSDVPLFDLFRCFVAPLEEALGVRASLGVGRTHGMGEERIYESRVDAVNFTLDHDDGIRLRDLKDADLILVGVSRCGKTPTCVYLAMQYGLKAANYPLTEEDFGLSQLPVVLQPYYHKLHGLRINAVQLARIREGRRPNSPYASLTQCRFEVGQAEALFRQAAIPVVDTTVFSIEEIAATILVQAGLQARHF